MAASKARESGAGLARFFEPRYRIAPAGTTLIPGGDVSSAKPKNVLCETEMEVALKTGWSLSEFSMTLALNRVVCKREVRA